MNKATLNRHHTDAVSLGFGLAFLALVGWWLIARWVAIDPPGIGWLFGGALVMLGILGVLATLITWRGRKTVESPDRKQLPQL
jgi:hypothetical protein